MSVTTLNLPVLTQSGNLAPRTGIHPKVLVSLGNTTLLLSTLGFLISIVVAYTHAEWFSMTTQIIAHVSMMLTAGTIKLGYILRLNGIHLQAQSEGSTP